MDCMELCGFIVDYCDVLSHVWLSFWEHPFTADNPLMSKICNATVIQIIYILDGIMVSKLSANFHFWVSYSLVQRTYRIFLILWISRIFLVDLFFFNIAHLQGHLNVVLFKKNLRLNVMRSNPQYSCIWPRTAHLEWKTHFVRHVKL